MKLSIDQILEKAFTSGDLASGGLLNPTQAAAFIQGVIDSSVIINECRREPMTGTKKQIDKITYAGDLMQKPVGVGTAPTVTSKPTTSKVTLDAQECIVAIDIGYDALEDSIEGSSLYNTILALTSKKLALEMDTLCLNGATAGGTGDYLEILNGVFQQISSHTYDANSATMSDTIAFNIIKQLPGKYLQNEGSFRIYTSHLARLDYVQALAQKGVNEAFVRYLIEANEPMYQGIPIRKVGAILTENITGATPSVLGSKALFINPANIVFGVHRDISYEFQRQPRKRIIEVTVTARVDFKLEEEDAAVKATKIKHSV